MEWLDNVPSCRGGPHFSLGADCCSPTTLVLPEMNGKPVVAMKVCCGRAHDAHLGYSVNVASGCVLELRGGTGIMPVAEVFNQLKLMLRAPATARVNVGQVRLPILATLVRPTSWHVKPPDDLHQNPPQDARYLFSGT